MPLSEPVDPTEWGRDLARDQLRDSLDLAGEGEIAAEFDI